MLELDAGSEQSPPADDIGTARVRLPLELCQRIRVLLGGPCFVHKNGEVWLRPCAFLK
jgi:hypothetical protein